MSRRTEIKQKQELQARFQLAISANHQKALNWLPPLKSAAAAATTTTSASSNSNDINSSTSDDSFMDLQIIPQGSSLSKLDNLQKIGDFINSKDITKMKQSTTTITTNRAPKSKPMLALMNKMRDNNRKNIRQTHHHHHHNHQQSTSNINKNKNKNKPVIPNKSKPSLQNYNANEKDQDEDEDDDDEDSRAMRSRTVKKGSSLLLENKLNRHNNNNNNNNGTKMKKNNIRPF
ncbi:conserved hypothetical protein [Candida dubliniensis CD36]|uniref:Uncharacterized protein n=1 Tax=Candida dubliniensis (strain CD36 / ATCC MYA-646 / CBS 7987 / NCPF 3949 / NRRL Y-17841) TaxID=573826 RepID=B9WI26_CANDC|nr:conserved hypothetical protein [Candida dubliniensis CD36]CAX41823.1 conserved hypothetical protein [Candida dubliniensis CD36]